MTSTLFSTHGFFAVCNQLIIALPKRPYFMKLKKVGLFPNDVIFGLEVPAKPVFKHFLK